MATAEIARLGLENPGRIGGRGTFCRRRGVHWRTGEAIVGTDLGKYLGKSSMTTASQVFEKVTTCRCSQRLAKAGRLGRAPHWRRRADCSAMTYMLCTDIHMYMAVLVKSLRVQMV